MYTLFFAEQLEDRIDSDGNPYQAYIIGGKEFLPNKVVVVGTHNQYDLVLITTSKDSWYRMAKLQPNYLGDNYLEMIMDSFIGYTDPSYPFVGNANIVRACIHVRYEEEVDGETVQRTSTLGEWIDAGQPGKKIGYRKAVKVLGLDID
jgi:hypothetical protein